VGSSNGDDNQQSFFRTSLRTEVELERDTRSRLSETRPPDTLKDKSSVCFPESMDCN